jgi:hypothetical protein
MPRKKRGEKYVVVQEGGSSGELYVHGFWTMKEARAFKRSAAEASYETTEPMLVPGTLDLYVVQDILDAVGEFR